MFDKLAKIKEWYERFERFNPIVFFFGGFTWDSLTLRRIDQMADNLILLAYLLLLGTLIVVLALVESRKLNHPLLLKYEQFLPLGLQFFLGGLFSAYVIFYFQSASFTKTGLFLGILVCLLVANEFLESRLRNLYLLLALYFLACFSFFIFFIPVLLKRMNLFTFLGGGLLSVLFVIAIIQFLHRKQVFPTPGRYRAAALLVVGLLTALNLLYFTNRIPPVPLSLKSAGIYHHARKSETGDDFILRFEKPKWYQPFKRSDKTFHYADGDTVSCFTAVFAPTRLTKKIYHHWQQYFPNRQEWLTTDRLGFAITGYRDGGYRGITRKKNVSEGKWRVNVETEEGILLGRIGFRVERVAERVPLQTIRR